MTQPASERRRHPRVRVDLPLSLTSETVEAEIRVKDISLSGVCCRTPLELGEMTQVAIGLDLPDADARRIEIRGVVVRCDPIAETDPALNDLAIFFTDFEGPSREALAAFLEKQLSGQIAG